MSKYNYPDYSLVIESAYTNRELVIPCCCSDSLTTLLHFAVATQGIKPVRVLNRYLKVVHEKDEMLQRVLDSTNLRNVCPRHNIEQMQIMVEFATNK